MHDATSDKQPLLQRIYTIQSDDDDIVRRGQSFIALCMAYIAFTASLVLILPLLPSEAAAHSIILLTAVSLNYSAGIAMTRRTDQHKAGKGERVKLHGSVRLSMVR